MLGDRNFRVKLYKKMLRAVRLRAKVNRTSVTESKGRSSLNAQHLGMEK